MLWPRCTLRIWSISYTCTFDRKQWYDMYISQYIIAINIMWHVYLCISWQSISWVSLVNQCRTIDLLLRDQMIRFIHIKRSKQTQEKCHWFEPSHLAGSCMSFLDLWSRMLSHTQLCNFSNLFPRRKSTVLRSSEICRVQFFILIDWQQQLHLGD